MHLQCFVVSKHVGAEDGDTPFFYTLPPNFDGISLVIDFS
jgi:hypothetical protein